MTTNELTAAQREQHRGFLRHIERHPMTGKDFPVDTRMIRWLLDAADRADALQAECEALRRKVEQLTKETNDGR